MLSSTILHALLSCLALACLSAWRSTLGLLALLATQRYWQYPLGIRPAEPLSTILLFLCIVVLIIESFRWQWHAVEWLRLHGSTFIAYPAAAYIVWQSLMSSASGTFSASWDLQDSSAVLLLIVAIVSTAIPIGILRTAWTHRELFRTVQPWLVSLCTLLACVPALYLPYLSASMLAVLCIESMFHLGAVARRAH